jgi:hypothetical protein
MGLCPLNSPERGGLKNPKKKAESPLRFVFRHVEPSHSAEQARTPCVKIKVKIYLAGDDQASLLQIFRIILSLPPTFVKEILAGYTVVSPHGAMDVNALISPAGAQAETSGIEKQRLAMRLVKWGGVAAGRSFLNTTRSWHTHH